MAGLHELNAGQLLDAYSLGDASPLVRAMAVWALSCLAPQRFRALRAVHANDPDPAVRREWMGEAA